jgi:hypothetical protein
MVAAGNRGLASLRRPIRPCDLRIQPHALREGPQHRDERGDVSGWVTQPTQRDMER